MLEIEAKILGIDCDEVRGLLMSAGAVFQSKKLFQTLLFSVPKTLPFATLRLRKEGEISKLTFKTHVKSESSHVKVREEKELEVNDFEIAKSMLLGLGYKVRLQFSKIREEYELEGAVAVIDVYQDLFSVIPPLLEIEAVSADEVIRIAEKLGFDRSQLSTKGLRDFVREYGLSENE